MSRVMDLTNKKFGRLLVIRSVGKNKDGMYVWECKCECGNTKIATTSNLNSGSTSSCGCYRKDSINYRIVYGNKNANNTSGYKGVYYDKSRELWKSEIGYDNKKYNLGRYKNINDAVAERKNAEEAIKDGTFDSYLYGLRMNA